jgi:predicted transglutaminase-like cysteine proteinase
MSRRTVARQFLSGILSTAAACVGAAATAQPLELPTIGPAVPAPRGFLEFCVREPLECSPADRADGALQPAVETGRRSNYWRLLFATAQPTGAPPADDGPRQAVVVTSALWRQMNTVNREINRAIRPRSDADEYGVEDYWALPLEDGRRYGDCEDYALEKRHALRRLGYPEKALSLALVQNIHGQSHAVLLVNTDRGEVVLDSLSPWVVSWRDTGYIWTMRQSPFHPEVWIAGPGYRPVG